MKIIAECGATKSDWRLVCDGAGIKQVLVSGINGATMRWDAVKDVVNEALEQLCGADDAIESLHIYVAGIVAEEVEANFKNLFATRYPSAEVEIQTDLVAAVRAACGHAPGIAAILGTGSNSCQWDGEKIVKKVAAGGFILGDEGSAAALGKLFLADYIKGLVPTEIAEDMSCSLQKTPLYTHERMSIKKVESSHSTIIKIVCTCRQTSEEISGMPRGSWATL